MDEELPLWPDKAAGFLMARAANNERHAGEMAMQRLRPALSKIWSADRLST